MGDNNHKTGRGKFWLGLLTGILAAGILSSVVVYASGLSSRKDAFFNRSGRNSSSAITSETVEKLKKLEQILDTYYYKADEITAEQKTDGVYKGLLRSLGDPYTVYYTSEEYQQFNQQLEGTYYGIGAYISLDEMTGYPKISGVMKGTPAEESGLMADDIIYEVAGLNTADMTLDEVVSHVRGEEGTTVTLTIYRNGEDDYLSIDVTRRKVNTPTVYEEMLEDKIGYIQIEEFDSVTTDQFKEAVASLQSQGMERMILDLRSNPGGDTDVATAVAGYFIPEGLVFYMIDSAGNRTEYACSGEDQLDLPLAVLVDGNSASSSEIVAGAIQDAGTGTIVGTQTYGKGVVQTLFPLTDGSAVKITIADYYTRNGNNIDKIGITPDVEAEFDRDAYREDGTDSQLQEAIRIVKGDQ